MPKLEVKSSKIYSVIFAGACSRDGGVEMFHSYHRDLAKAKKAYADVLVLVSEEMCAVSLIELDTETFNSITLEEFQGNIYSIDPETDLDPDLNGI